jgi:hypothetical protein
MIRGMSCVFAPRAVTVARRAAAGIARAGAAKKAATITTT